MTLCCRTRNLDEKVHGKNKKRTHRLTSKAATPKCSLCPGLWVTSVSMEPEGKTQKVQKNLRKEPGFAATGENSETGIQQLHNRNLPAPQRKRATQHRRLRLMGKAGQVAFSLSLPIPHQ